MQHDDIDTATDPSAFTLDGLEAYMEGLWAQRPGAFSDGASVVQTERIRRRLDALAAREVHEFDTWGEWQPSGAKSAAAWIAVETHLPRAEAKRLVRRGRTMKDLKGVAASFGAGAICGSHLDVMARLRTPRTEEALARDEELLVTLAEEHSFSDFERLGAYWAMHADPEGAEDAALARAEGRDAYVVGSIGGTFFGKQTLDAIGGEIVANELSRLSDLEFQADWAEATERLGREPTVSELARTDKQRRADAFVKMAINSASTPPGAQKPAPLFSVLVGAEQLKGAICELEHSRIPLPPGSLMRFYEVADFERALFAPGGRVEVSKRSRFFTGAIRRALELRDQQCSHPYCEERAEYCEGDHILEYSKGGETTQENGRLFCPFHHRWHHQRPPPDDEA